MQNNKYFLKKLFIPFSCLLILIGAASLLSRQLGFFIHTSIPQEGSELTVAKEWFRLGIVFLGVLFMLKTIRFKILFRVGLIIISLLLISSTYLFQHTRASYDILIFFCPLVLSFLAWAYINQLTHLFEGAKYYFALLYVAGLAMIPLNFLLQKSTLLFSSLFLLISALVCLAMVGVCDRWIHRQAPNRASSTEVSVSFSYPWITTILLAVILSGQKIAAYFNNLSFKASIDPLTLSASEYTSLMGKHSFILGVGILGISTLSLWMGPKLLRTQGWKRSALIAPILGVVALLAPWLSPQISAYTLNQVIFKSLEYAWVFPLIQISFLTFPVQDRFKVQAWVFLILVPLFESKTVMEWVRQMASVLSPSYTLVLPFTILACMAICILIIAKRKIALSKPLISKEV